MMCTVCACVGVTTVECLCQCVSMHLRVLTPCMGHMHGSVYVCMCVFVFVHKD